MTMLFQFRITEDNKWISQKENLNSLSKFLQTSGRTVHTLPMCVANELFSVDEKDHSSWNNFLQKTMDTWHLMSLLCADTDVLQVQGKLGSTTGSEYPSMFCVQMWEDQFSQTVNKYFQSSW